MKGTGQAFLAERRKERAPSHWLEGHACALAFLPAFPPPAPPPSPPRFLRVSSVSHGAAVFSRDSHRAHATSPRNAGRPSQLSLQKTHPGGKTARATTGVRGLRNHQQQPRRSRLARLGAVTDGANPGILPRACIRNHPRSPRLARSLSLSLSFLPCLQCSSEYISSPRSSSFARAGWRVETSRAARGARKRSRALPG